MKARAVAVRPVLPVVIAVEVIALVAFATLTPTRFGWWPAAAVTAAALILLVVRVHRRNIATWVRDRIRWRATRTAVVQAGAAVDLPLGSSMCGVRVEPDEAITMVDVAGRAYAPTFLRGSTVSRTVNVLPLRVLVDALDQPGGLRLAGIDVVSAGHRVRRGTDYPALYSTLLADRPAAGARSTRLIVRLDLHDSVEGLVYRQSIGTAAAAATDRILTALRQEGVRCTALTAAELDAALDELSVGLASAPVPPAPEDTVAEDPESTAAVTSARTSAPAVRPELVTTVARRGPATQVKWRTVDGRPGHLTSYYFSPEDITTASLHQMWALRSDAVVHTISLRKDRSGDPEVGGKVLVSALVRTDDPQVPQQPPTLYLNPLPGAQGMAVLRTAPTSRPKLTLPALTLTDPDALEIPIGPTGILVGAALADDPAARPEVQRDDLVMVALTDPHRATRIVMDTSEFYVRQLVIRAAAAGERIAIYSQRPDRWMSVAQPNVAVVQRGRRAEFVPTIVVNDHPTNPPSAGLASTVITAARGGNADPNPDLRFVQTSKTTVRITSAERTLDVGIIAFRQEQAWTR